MSTAEHAVRALLSAAETREDLEHARRAAVALAEAAFYAGWDAAARPETSLRVAACAEFVSKLFAAWKPTQI